MSHRDDRAAWEAVSERAGHQYGLLTGTDLKGRFSRRQVQRRAEQGLLIRCAPGLWRLPAWPMTWEQQVMASCLVGGTPTAASHTCAAVIWKLDGVAFAGVHVTLPRSRSATSTRRTQLGPFPAVIHRAELEHDAVRYERGLPVTSAARTLVDIAGLVTPTVLGLATDDALRRRLTTIPRVKAERALRTTRGLAQLDPIIDRRSQSGIGDSAWEDRVWDWIAAAGLPPPIRHLEVNLPSGRAVLDFAYPSYKVAVEFDGFFHHGTRSRFDRDQVRRTDLQTVGWLLVVVTSAQSEAFAVGQVQRALLVRGWRPAA